jgi:hypothetical protein
MRVRKLWWTAAVTGGLAAALVAGSPASAHVEVAADNPKAGATNVTLTFTGEAESATAGIAAERVVLPAGMSPSGVSLVKAPKGWTFKAGADGFTVGGTPLAKGTDAKWSVKVTSLPTDRSSLAFKVLETYGDGEIQRWIDLRDAGQPEPEHPAPVLTVKGATSAAPTTATTTAATTAPATASPAPAATTDAAQAATAGDDSGPRAWPWILVALVAVALIAAAIMLTRRRRGAV